MPASTGLSIEDVRAIHKDLSKAMASGTSKDIAALLAKLKEGVVPTEELIRATKIGQVVGKLRTHSDADIASQAKALVQGWKAVVDKERAQKPGKSSAPSASGSAASKPANGTGSGSGNATASATPTISSPAQGSASPATNAGNASASTAASTPPDFNILRDKTRNACLKLLFDSLKMAEVPGVNDSRIFAIAIDIEESVLDKHGGETEVVSPEYRNKVRSLSLNLKDKKNPQFRQRVVKGEVPARTLVDLTPAQMASEERLAENRSLQEQNMLVAQSAAEQTAETDAFQCGRCKQRKCRYYQKQTRSADEPMTTFVTCTNCNHRWKFC